MQELVDMLRMMAGACKALASDHPKGMAYAAQAVANGSLPGIRAGLTSNVMVRITIERQSNVENAEAAAWNTLWVDPEHEQSR